MEYENVTCCRVHTTLRNMLFCVSNSVGRVELSKSSGRGFESFLACKLIKNPIILLTDFWSLAARKGNTCVFPCIRTLWSTRQQLECVTKLSLVRKEKQLGNLWMKVFLYLRQVLWGRGYPPILSQWGHEFESRQDRKLTHKS